MENFFQPSPVLLAIITIKEFVILPLLLIFAVIRSFACRGPARVAALAALLLCLWGLFTQFSGALLNLHSGPLARAGGIWGAALGGWLIFAAPALALLLAGRLRGGRFWLIDVLIILGAIALVVAPRFA